MLTNPSQVIIRNSELFENKRVLILNYENDLLPKHLLENASEVEALALDYNHHLQIQAYESDKLKLYFGHKLPHSDEFDAAVIYFPKAKNLAPYLLHLAAHHLKTQGQLYIVGENKGGIKSINKLIPDFFEPAIKLDSARHCALFATELISQTQAIDLEDWYSQYQLKTPQGSITICNLVGVFSEKRLDAGTELLLSHLPELTGRVLDFGCGAGVITAALLKQQPELNLECVDINAMALASCQLTLAANEMKAKVYPSDGIPENSGQFDAIISNPPFHDGLMSTTDIATKFVKDSSAKLTKNGLWQIVANRHLPYSETIATYFGQFSTPAENNKYKLYKNKA